VIVSGDNVANEILPNSTKQRSHDGTASAPNTTAISSASNFQITSGVTGNWYDKSQGGHGLSFEVLPNNGFLAEWFVYAPFPQGGQAWIFAQGSYTGNVATLTAAQDVGAGALFPPNFDPNAIHQQIWGTITVTFSDSNNAQMDYSSVIPGYGGGSLPLVRLTQPATDPISAGGAFQITPSITGNWFDKDQSGHGLAVEVLPNNGFLAEWFVYAPSPQGGQAWIFAQGTYSGATATLTAAQDVGAGALFPPNFDPNAIHQQIWGTINLTFSNSNTGQLHYSSVIPGYGSGSLPLVRLTQPAGVVAAAANADANGAATLKLGNLTLPLQLLDYQTRAPLAGLMVAAAVDSSVPGRALLLIGDPAQKYQVQIVVLESGDQTSTTAVSAVESATSTPVYVPVPVLPPSNNDSVATTVVGPLLTTIFGNIGAPPVDVASEFKDLVMGNFHAISDTAGLHVPPLFLPLGSPTLECADPILPDGLLDELGKHLTDAGATNAAFAVIAAGAESGGSSLLPVVVEGLEKAQEGLETFQMGQTLYSQLHSSYYQDAGADNLTLCSIRFGSLETTILLPKITKQPPAPWYPPQLPTTGCHVTDQYGQPLSQGSLQLISTDTVGLAVGADLNGSGSAVIPIPPGNYNMTARAPGYQPHMQNFTVASSPSVCDVALQSSSTPLPNLTPYQPDGWSDKIVVSKTTGTFTDSNPLHSTDSLFVSSAVINNGQAPTSVGFYTTLYVDGIARNSFYYSPALAVNGVVETTNYSIGVLSAGSHTVVIVADATNVIAETQENDNQYTKTITIVSALSISPVNGSGQQGTAFSLPRPEVSGGTPPYQFNATGSLAGSTIDPTTGILTIPASAAAGTYTFTLCVVDSSSQTACAPATAVVNAPASATLSWTISDQCNNGAQIYYKFFDVTSTPELVWPAPPNAYVISNGQSFQSNLSCSSGDKVCYGAQSGSDVWGVGLNGTGGCTSCCGICGQGSYGATLTCGSSGGGTNYYANWSCGSSSQCASVMGGAAGSSGPFCSLSSCQAWGNYYIPGGYTCSTTPTYTPNPGGQCTNYP